MIENPDLLAFLKEEEVRSRNEELQIRAETNLRSYKGDFYGDEVDGRSKAVSRDVAEVIDHMEVSVLRTFVSGDRVVEFEPLSQADEQAADDATEVMRRDFSRKGYRLLHDWFKEGNINIVGIAKACVETQKVKRTHIMPAAMQMAHGEVVSSEPAGTDPLLGEMLSITTLEEEIKFVDRLVPLEEFRFSPDACTLDEAAYLAQASWKTISDLVEMGFDVSDVEDASYDYTQQETSLAQTRSVLNYFSYNQDRQGVLRQVVLMEEYVLFDLDQDGIAERICVHRVGDNILRVEEVDYQPFRAYCPFPMPGRVEGEALAEKVTDIQRINTALMRIALDGLYTNLAPGYLVPDSAVNENTFDDLLTVRPNRIVRYSGANPPVMEQKQDVSGVAFQAIEFMVGQRESRTGITRLNQGLDAETLNKTATGTALLQAQGQQIEEYLARNFAESLSGLMQLKYQLYRRYSPPIRLRVDGQYRVIDPSQWPDEMDIIIRIGLGTGKKEQKLQSRMLLLQIQREVMMGGLPIVGPEQIYKSIAGVVRDSSLGSPSDFVIDPKTIPPAPPQPSPEQMKLMGEQQLAAARLQGEQQVAAAKMQLAMLEANAKADLERAKLEAELQVAREKANIENALAELKAQGIQLEHNKTAHAAMLAESEAAHRAALDNDRAVFEANLAQGKAAREAMLAEREAALAESEAAHRAALENDRAVFDANLAHSKASREAMLAESQAAIEANLSMRKMDSEAAIKANIADLKAQLDSAEAALAAQLARDKATEEAQLTRDKATEGAKLARDKAMHEAQLAEDKAVFEANLAVREQQFNEDLARREADRADAVAARTEDRADHVATRKANRSDFETENKVKNNRPGGRLDE